MILIKNVTVVSSQGRETRDVSIESEKEEVVDGSGKFLLPGLIDSHVHFRDPGFPEKEDWASGSAAALAGGITTVLDMPNTNPATITVEALEAKRTIAKTKSKVHFGLFFGATRDNLEEIRKAENICGIKIYMGSSTGNLLLDDPIVWEEVFKIAKEKNVPVVVHAETESFIRAGRRDCECARVATEAAILLREKIGNRLHIAHISCKSEVELMRAYKCSELTCEVTPHHLLFTKKDQKDAFLKTNPPLRGTEDVEALWEGLRDGTIDCIATDHAPHTIQEKQAPLDQAPAGVPGVEFVLPLMLNAVNEGRLTLERLVSVMSKNPARIFGISPKGWVLVDMNVEKIIRREDVKSKCGWSPYEKRAVKGWPVKISAS
ncbi:MAG: dihydroorotase [Candidatus Gracilibacteria bacterium]